MSIKAPSRHVRDLYGSDVNALVTVNAFFGALLSLIDYRRQTHELTKTKLAYRLGKDKGTITKLTSKPTNMKIETVAHLAYAMDARAVLLFVANEDSNIVFTSTGVRNCGSMPVKVMEAQNIRLGRAMTMTRANWAHQNVELVDA